VPGAGPKACPNLRSRLIGAAAINEE